MSNLPINRTANELDISQLAGGAIQDKVNMEMAKIARNLRDPNTKPGTKRELNIKITFATDDDRDLITSEATVVGKLAPLKGVNTKMVLGQSSTGEPVLKELLTSPKVSGKHEIIEHEGNSAGGFNRYNKN